MAPLRSSRVLTVMFTDIKGFAERTSSTSREELLDLLNQHDELLLPVVRRFGGQIVKTIGDALLATFESPTNAVLAGLLIQERLRTHNSDRIDNQQLHVRVAINTGELEERNGDVFGEAVNIAARIETLAEPGEVYFTESVYLAMNKAEVPTSSVGRFRLKGIPEQIQVYRVLRNPDDGRYQALLSRLRAEQQSGKPAAPAGVAARPAAVIQAPVNKLAWGCLTVMLLFGLAAGGWYWLAGSEYQVQLRQARNMLVEQQIEKAVEHYRALLQHWPEDWALHQEVVERLGHNNGVAAHPLAQQAMDKLLPTLRERNQTLSDVHIHTMVDSLFQSTPYGKQAELSRQELAPYHDVLEPRMWQAFAHKDSVVRLHAKLYLQTAAVLPAKQELAFHWRNARELPIGYRRELIAAAEYFQNLSDPEVLASVRLAAIGNAMAWRADTKVSQRLMDGLTQAFGQTLLPLLETWRDDSVHPPRASMAQRAINKHWSNRAQ